MCAYKYLLVRFPHEVLCVLAVWLRARGTSGAAFFFDLIFFSRSSPAVFSVVSPVRLLPQVAFVLEVADGAVLSAWSKALRDSVTVLESES